ncbi:MAG: hypothetical protein JW395_0470 [Nitrospira sp.]|nr:hypothetical protein [Nitrospira sp.]
MTERTGLRRATGGIERVGCRCQGAQFVGAGTYHFSHDKHLDASEPSHRHVKIESFQQAAQLAMENLVDLGKGDSCHRDGAELRDEYRPISFDRADMTLIEARIRHIPNMNGQRILRPQHVLRADRRIHDLWKPGKAYIEKIIPELFQLTGCALKEKGSRERVLDGQLSYCLDLV